MQTVAAVLRGAHPAELARRATPIPGDATPMDTPMSGRGTAESPRTSSGASPTKLVLALERIVELEGEVARLKRELSSRSAVPAWRDLPVRGRSGKDDDKQVTPHGENCMGICCRALRSAG